MKMRNILIFTIVSLLFVNLTSCDYLDKAPEAEGLDFMKVFGDSGNYQRYTEMLVMRPFYLQLENGVKPTGSHDCGISDNSISSVTFTGCPSVRACNGDYYNLRTNADAVWSNNGTWAEIWKHVRVANDGIRYISY